MKRIDEQAKLTETVHKLASSIDVLVTKLEATDKKIDENNQKGEASTAGINKKIDKLTTDIDEIKQKPAKKWDETIKIIISVVVTAVVTFVLVRLGLK